MAKCYTSKYESRIEKLVDYIKEIKKIGSSVAEHIQNKFDLDCYTEIVESDSFEHPLIKLVIDDVDSVIEIDDFNGIWQVKGIKTLYTYEYIEELYKDLDEFIEENKE